MLTFLERVHTELFNFKATGMSVMELSHRGHIAFKLVQL